MPFELCIYTRVYVCKYVCIFEHVVVKKKKTKPIFPTKSQLRERARSSEATAAATNENMKRFISQLESLRFITVDREWL